MAEGLGDWWAGLQGFFVLGIALPKGADQPVCVEEGAVVGLGLAG